MKVLRLFYRQRDVINMNNLFKFNKLGSFATLFIAISVSIFYYNVFSIPLLEKKVNLSYQEVIDITKRFHGYYINANEINLEEGIHHINNVGVVVNKTGKVKVLSPAITLLNQTLSEVINNDFLWTVAVIEKLYDENRGNSYFKPLRDNYIKFNDKNTHDTLMLDRIIKLEKLERNYKGFHNDDIRVTEVYEEQWTNERIHSIIYPIYLNTKLVSIIIVDIKEGWNNHLISQFNNKQWIFIKSETGFSWSTFRIKLPYTSNNSLLNVSIDVHRVIAISLFITSLIYVIALVLYYFYFKIQRIRCYDHMTGFYRRDFYENKLLCLKGVSLLLIDIDYFKKVNDVYGHDVGDRVIKEVTQRLRAQIRSKDIAIRWGGEEFILIFPKMNESDLAKKSEVIRACIEKEQIHNMSITISIGGTKQVNSEAITNVIERADKALYQSKRLGRNRVTLA